MRVKSVSYKKLVNLGNYQNEELGIEVELEDGESPSEAVSRAKAFVENSLKPKLEAYEVERLKDMLNNEDEHSPKQLREVKRRLELSEADIPF